MTRPVLKTYQSPKTVKAREAFVITMTVEDLELIFSSDKKYAAENAELCAGEEGII